MYRSINEWRQNKNVSKQPKTFVKNEDFSYILSPEHTRETQHIIDAALAMELDRNATVNLIRNIFTDPLQAPENISVPFVADNLDKIMDELRSVPDTKFATPIGYTESMLSNNSPLECVFLTKDSNLFRKTDGFLVEGNIVYVPDTTKLSPLHNKRIISFLKMNTTKNLIEHIKWTRKTRK